MGKNKSAYCKIALDFLIAIVGIILLVFVVPKLAVCFMPFLIGWIVSLIANPTVKFLEKKIKIVRKHGSAIFIVLVIAIIVGLIYAAGYFIYDQAKSMSKEAPQFYENFKEQYADITDKYEEKYEKLPKFVKNYVENFREDVTSKKGLKLTGDKSSIDLASMAVKNVVLGIVYTIFTILAAYFFIVDRDMHVEKAKKILSKNMQKNLKLIKDNFCGAVGGYFKAQFKIMFILIGIMYVTFLVIKVKYSFLLAVFTGILDVLPVFGTGAVLWPCALYYLLTKKYVYAAVTIVLYIVCQLVKQFLQPKMVGDSIGLNPLLTLFLLFVGYKIGGLIGILVALPVGIVVINFYKAGAFDIWKDDIKFILKRVDEFQNKNQAYIHEEVVSISVETDKNVDVDKKETDITKK